MSCEELAAMERRGPKNIKWTAVETEMPDSDIVVLIHDPNANEPVWMGYHDGECWREVSAAKVNVTHWAHLPNPPEAA